MRKRAKFRMGQVVAFRNEHPTRQIWFGKVRVVSLPEGGQLYNVDGYAVREDELRPLTSREAGKQRSGSDV